MNTELARQKYLKDLFYNKIKERKEYLHKCFIKLYYKGLYLEMKYKGRNRNISLISSNSNKEDNKTNNDNSLNKSNVNENSLLNKTNIDNSLLNKTNDNSILNRTNYDFLNNNENKLLNSNNNILNSNEKPKINLKGNKINNEIEKEKIKENEKVKENENIKEITIEVNSPEINEQNKINVRREKAKNLRKFLRNREKEKKDKLRTYFYKFFQAGIIYAMKKEGRRRRTLKLQSIKETSKLTLNKIKTIDITSKINETQESILKFEDSDDENLKKKNNNNNINEKRCEKLEHLIYKKNRFNVISMKNNFQKWNLVSKLLKMRNTQLMKKPKKKKVSSVSKKKIKHNESLEKLPTERDKSIPNSIIKRRSNKTKSVISNITNLNNSLNKDNSENLLTENDEYVDYQEEIKKHYLIGKLFKEKLIQKIAFYFHLWKNVVKKEKILIFKGNLFFKFLNNFQRKINTEKLRHKFSIWRNIINRDLKIDVTLRKFIQNIKIIFIERFIDKFLIEYKFYLRKMYLKKYLKKKPQTTFADLIIDLVSKITKSDNIVKNVLEKNYKNKLFNYLKEKSKNI